MIVVSGFFAYVNGSMFGLIPVAYLTTVAAK